MVWANANSEGVLKLAAGNPPTLSGSANDSFAPRGADNQQWYDDDTNDWDLGSSGVVLFDVPGATPGQLAFAVGKTQTTYLLDRTNLGGINDGLQKAPSTIYTTDSQVFGSMFAYATQCGSYVGFQQSASGFCNGGDTSIFRVTRTSPPQLSYAWCVGGGGEAGPIASTTGGLWTVMVWTYGAAGSETLQAFDGDNGGNPLMSVASGISSEHWITPIIAGGRVYVAGDGAVVAFTVR